MKHGISVIICCYNSAERIEVVLYHIEKQKNTDELSWEVILVDNASQDNTAEIARKYWTRGDVPLKIVKENVPGLSNARKKGLGSSSYSTVIFVDDDNLLADGYISRAHKIMSEYSNVGLAGGLGIPVSTVELPEWFSEHQNAFAVGPQAEKDGYLPYLRTYLHGAGLVMRKKVWDSLLSEGFDFFLSGRKGKSLSSGEDFEISAVFRIAGYQLWYDSQLEFQHIIPKNRLMWTYIINLSREFGKASVIHDLYKSKIRNFTGWDRIKTDFWVLSLLVCLRNLLMLIPDYLWTKLRKIKGTQKEYRFVYYYGALIQHVNLTVSYTHLTLPTNREV